MNRGNTEDENDYQDNYGRTLRRGEVRRDKGACGIDQGIWVD
jgi:hypothetical protein